MRLVYAVFVKVDLELIFAILVKQYEVDPQKLPVRY